MIFYNRYVLLLLIFILIYWMCCNNNNDDDKNNNILTFEKLKVPIFVTCIIYIILFSQDNISEEIYNDPIFLRC